MYNRNRYQVSSPGFGIWKLTTAIKWIIIANLAVYITELITYNWLENPSMIKHLSLIPWSIYPGLEVYQVFTYMWLHDPGSPGHLILNMFALWMFGTILEERWGSITFLKFYVVCGILAGICVFISGILFGKSDSLTLGASGAIFAVIIAFGISMPNLPVYFLGLLPIKAKWIVYTTIGGTVLYWLAKTPGISISAHIGGMISGALIVTGWWNPVRAYKNIKIAYLRRKLKIIEGNKKSDENPPPVYH